MKIEFVTHCYCPPTLKIYAKHLRIQLESLRHTPAQACVCYTRDDEITCRTLSDFGVEHHGEMTVTRHNGLNLRTIPMEQRTLFRRSIGRNIAALTSAADVVWFTDADYFFNPAPYFRTPLEHHDWTDAPFIFPATVNRSKTHADGDALLASEYPVTTNIDDNATAFCHFVKQSQWMPVGTGRAIGGIQIVSGDIARKWGYLNNDKRWQRPVDEADGFRRCRCDVAYRRWLNAKANISARHVSIPHVYRIRHTTNGRDLDAAGQPMDSAP